MPANPKLGCQNNFLALRFGHNDCRSFVVVVVVVVNWLAQLRVRKSH